ncbi:2-hydroxychromene-2-carboxylate isomerase [Maricaulis sp.]|uniref:2-hydroxychromene-2-carboxylate isomerase n=1 Tax=Maricaulis sp. TaxID=1486257 RepID=UPI003A8E9420
MTDPASDAVFYFDFASPNAYFAHRILPGVEARTGLKFRYVPVLLGGIFKSTGNQAPMIAFAGVPAKLAYEYKEIERFIARHDLKGFNFNPHFPVNTLALMRGAVAAEAEGVLAPYVEAMFHFMWEKPRKLDDGDVFHATLTEAGLPAERLLELIATPDIKAQLMANTQTAVDQGMFGIPSFVVGGELYFGKDRLESLAAALIARSA